MRTWKLFPLHGVERALFKTENSKHWNDGRFYEEFVYLEPEAAQLLVDSGVKLVGIDYLSIDKYQSENIQRTSSCLDTMSSLSRDSI